MPATWAGLVGIAALRVGWGMLFRMVPLLLVLALAAGLAWGTEPTPTTPPFYKLMDSRRTPTDIDVDGDGNWNDSYTIGAGLTVSALVPAAHISPTAWAKGTISPPFPTGSRYLAKVMGELPVAQDASNTLQNGKGWEPDRQDNVVKGRGASDVRWIAIKNPNLFTISLTVNWSALVSQTQ